MRDLTYADLPDSTLDSGISLRCSWPCEYGAGPWSATRGDYFMHGNSELVTCGYCDEPMVLVQEQHSFVTIDPATRKALR